MGSLGAGGRPEEIEVDLAEAVAQAEAGDNDRVRLLTKQSLMVLRSETGRGSADEWHELADTARLAGNIPGADADRAEGLRREPCDEVSWVARGLARMDADPIPCSSTRANVLVTIRGRKTGQPRTQPLAIFSDGERRWLIGTFGDTNWCRNLRANPDIEVRRGRRSERLHARELTLSEGEQFFGHDLPTGISHLPLYLRLFSRVFLRATAPVMKTDPIEAARRHPVFELGYS
jgi:deazaflavin-dependent oxidoreductase (nitroreductase family)